MRICYVLMRGRKPYLGCGLCGLEQELRGDQRSNAVVKDKVIVGTSGGDDGVRGFVAAYDAQTGKLAWRLWTIPAPGEFGSESWPGKLYLHGGGTTWMPGTYDADLNTIYWGTSNPSPDFEGSVRHGG